LIIRNNLDYNWRVLHDMQVAILKRTVCIKYLSNINENVFLFDTEKKNNATQSGSRLGDKSDQEGHRNTNQCHQNVGRNCELLNGSGFGGRGSGSRGTRAGAGGRAGRVDGASIDTLQTGQNTLTTGARVVGDNGRNGSRACQVKVPFIS
jgi:hypothetical protein